MVTREEIGEFRDEIARRRDELMERAIELRERFVESADEESVAMAFGLSLVGTGVALGVTQALRGRRKASALLLPVGLIAAGFFVAGRGFMSRRTERIAVAEARVRDELSTLDPLAKARVLRDVASEQLAFIRRERD